MTDEQKPLPVSAAELKKVIVDAAAQVMPDVNVRALLDVDTQKLHVQISGKRPTYDEFREAFLRKIAADFSLSYEDLTREWPPAPSDRDRD